MGIPHTYYDGNAEDRAYIPDFSAWLEQQPQQAWLYYARKANWDQAFGGLEGRIDREQVRSGHSDDAFDRYRRSV